MEEGGKNTTKTTRIKTSPKKKERRVNSGKSLPEPEKNAGKDRGGV